MNLHIDDVLQSLYRNKILEKLSDIIKKHKRLRHIWKKVKEEF